MPFSEKKAPLSTNYTLIRGHLSGHYPYPFMDAGQLGMSKVLINIGAMLVLFLVISLLLVAISKVRSVR